MNKNFINKTGIAVAVGSVLMGVSGVSYAVLDETTILNVTTGSGSYFTMGDKTGIPPTIAAAGFDGQFLVGNDGLILGSIQTPAGSHGGAIDGSEVPTVDAPWIFFGNTGMSGTTSASNVLSASGNTATLDLSGWAVAWNGLDGASGNPTIPMGSGAWYQTTTDGVAQITCDTSCDDGEGYTLIYSATVPAGDPSNFGGTKYFLSLTGTISDTNIAPVISPLASMSMLGLASDTLDITSNVSDSHNNHDFATLNFSSNTCSDTPTHNNAGVISYIDTGGVAASCSFNVSITDTEGKTSNTQTVNVEITLENPKPIAVDDGSAAAPIIVNENSAIEINVTANDTDNTAIDVTSVIPVDGSIGTAVADSITGIVTYTPNADTFGNDTFTYTVSDDQGLSSDILDPAIVTIKVNALPVANDPDPITLDRLASANFVVDASDADGTIDLSTLQAPLNSTCEAEITHDDIGRISITSTGSAITDCAFEYTVDDDSGATSLPATASISIVNAIPIANIDNAEQFDMEAVSSVSIDIASNDTDTDGTIDPASIVIVTGASNGTVTINDPSAGFITYTPDPNYSGEFPFSDSISYTIDDNDAATSLPETVNFSVDSSIGQKFLPRDAILTIEPSDVGSSVLVQPEIGTGSWFSMLLAPGEFTHTSISGLNHLQLGKAQLGQVNPTIGNIDEPWEFVGNSGIHQSTANITVLSDPGDGTATLNFSGWNVGWAAIPSINMSAGPDNGVASITCTAGDDEVADCSYGDRYALDYNAIVPEGDPSNFGGVNYRLHLEGEILEELPILGCNDSTTPYTVEDIEAGDCDGNSEGNTFDVEPGEIATLAGNTSGHGLSVEEIGTNDPRVNPDNGEQCFGGCLDFTISEVEIGASVNIIYKLSKPIEAGLVFRKLINGRWENFDRSGGDAIGSAATSAGMCQTQAGTYASNLVEGDECILIRITDGGPNDADGLANGIITDPGGLLLAGTPNTPPSSNDGCSMSGNTVQLSQRADWLLLFGFIAWLGLVIRKKQA